MCLAGVEEEDREECFRMSLGRRRNEERRRDVEMIVENWIPGMVDIWQRISASVGILCTEGLELGAFVSLTESAML